MKKNDWLIACSAIVFAVLFYEQSSGINYLIFTIMYGILNMLVNSKTLSKIWYSAYLLNLLCAFNIFNVHTDLAVFAWIISFIHTIGKTFDIKNSILLGAYFSVVSFVSSFKKIAQTYFLKKENSKKSNLIYVAAIFISFFLILLFFFLYKGANPLFADFTAKIDFSWLDIPLIFTILFGFYLVFTITHPYVNLNLSARDNTLSENLIMEDENQDSEVKKFVGLIAILVFISLNIMLLSLNILDIKMVFITEKLPTNIFLSDFVHDAVACIVASIVFAIILIVGIQHFKIKNKLIKILVYSWIIQSLVMVYNTALRNFWYSYDQITYLRIGVFVFLSLCIFGLLYTAYSLLRKRNYWFLLNLNLQTWFMVLVLSSFFPWDRMITKHNLNYSKTEKIDLEYLNSLSTNNLDLLVDFHKKHPELVNIDELNTKRNEFKQVMKNKTWQNFNLTDHRIYHHLKAK